METQIWQRNCLCSFGIFWVLPLWAVLVFLILYIHLLLPCKEGFLIFFQLFWGVINNIVIYLKSTKSLFDKYIHCEWIPSIKLIETLITSDISLYFLVRTFQFCSVANFSYTIHIVKDTDHVICYILRPYSYNWKFASFYQRLPVSPTLSPLGTPFLLFLWVWIFEGFPIYVIPCSICLLHSAYFT